METPPPLPVVLALSALIDGLLDAVAARYGVFPIRGPLLLFLWKRLDRIKQRFEKLAARFAAGKDLRPRPRAARAARQQRDDKNAFRITRWVNPTCGWLCRVASGSIGAAAFAYGLRALLTTDPEMRALLAATPATARLLRPLCWMLGVRDLPPVARSASSPHAPPPEFSRADDAAPPGNSGATPRATAAPEPPRLAPAPPDPAVDFLKAA